MSDDRKIRILAVNPVVREAITGALLLSMLLVSCKQPTREPVILRFPNGWRFEPEEIPNRTALTQQFTQHTGIQIREMPQPESTFDQLDLWRTLLKPGPSGIDLLGIDLIWSATLESNLVDLARYSTTEISSLDPELLPFYTVNGSWWPSLIKFMWVFWNTESISCANTDMTILRGPGTSWNAWPGGFRRVSGLRGRKTSGASCGKGRLRRY
jgi:hypothetical protein